MSTPARLPATILLLAAVALSPGVAESAVPQAIVGSPEAPFAERLAAREIARYLYVCTGTLVPVLDARPEQGTGGLIVVGSKDTPAVKGLLNDAKAKEAVADLQPEQYVRLPLEVDGRPVQLVAGGCPVGTLYGAYRLAEHLGVRFYLHGDVVPDTQIPLAMPQVRETGKPLFDRRGIQPFHDFPEGPDWWNAEACKAIMGQLPKLRMNFFGLHTYLGGFV